MNKGREGDAAELSMCSNALPPCSLTLRLGSLACKHVLLLHLTPSASPQVERAMYHNARQGLSAQCKAVRGNFLEMPFEAGTFDGAYAMEATCHAPTLEQARGGQHLGLLFVTPVRCGWQGLRCMPTARTASRAALPAEQVYSEVYRVLKPGAIFMTCARPL